MNLTPTQTRALAQMARQQIKVVGIITVRRSSDTALFDDLLDHMTDEDAIREIAGPGDAAIDAPTHHDPVPPEPTPEPREKASLIAEWVTAGQDAYRRGAARSDMTGGKRQLPHMQAGWDHAKAEAEAKLAVPGPAPDEADMPGLDGMDHIGG